MTWRRVLLLVGAIVVLAIAVVLVVGALMPRTHVAASSIVLHQPVDTVWAAVRDFERLPDWWKGVSRVERVAGAGGGEVWAQHAPTGTLTIAVESADPPRRLVTRIVADSSAAFGGTWTYELTPTDGGTRVTVTEAGYINNPFFRFVANLLVGLHGTADSYLRGLAGRFGEVVEPEHVR